MKYRIKIIVCFLIVASCVWGCNQANEQIEKPNVIFILTDDQGIGDLGCHGNPWLKTPNIDAFYAESVRLTDFHVSPVCTPTRSAFMTGQYPINNGAWATFKGRAALHENTKTIADIFKDNGYQTGMFGKWHLGNNYPSRPTDMGFQEAIHHEFGGIGEITDYWGNDYFDDVYLANNRQQQFSGYCTDVWFDETMKFIKRNKEKPFFVYLPTNAAHHPLNVDEAYAAPYKDLEGKEIPSANFYGMIANIDENMGRLNQFLEDNNLIENTIVVFATDNGSQFGYSEDGNLGYNKGFEGRKGDIEEGGHRVPFFIRWPNGKIQGGKDLNILASHVDLIPTLSGLCGFTLSEDLDLDGIDLSNAIKNDEKVVSNRTVFVHNNQDWRPPHSTKKACIMKGNWRLLNGTMLYDIQADPKQNNDVSSQFPEVVQELIAENEQFIAKAKQKDAYQNFPVEICGSLLQAVTTLTIQNAIGNDTPVWKQSQIAQGKKNKNNKYSVGFATSGKYQVSCRRWPIECPGLILGIPAKNPDNQFDYQTISPEKVRLKIFDKEYLKEVEANSEEVAFEIDVKTGHTMLEADFIEEEANYGVYYIYIKKLD
ncbi:arylsulfatase [Tamlana fucoidanivorans]|uniref:Arylsulfatase n=1 Tax=Allotamlana fucoidanivorans TaxID=2583814 RepID=A0A5C4SLZ9_9FLAO|nr:arylsulfatase [Tamlana fucoidanivorans]TNJ44699.1 arylsulfatase [Tamlana fucoidanivorans]